MRGRKPKPPHLRLIQGRHTGHKAKDTRTAPKLPVEVGKPPRWLSKEAKREWRTIVPALKEAGLLARLDTAQLAMWCQTVARYAEAQTNLNREGLFVTMPSGIVRTSQWFKVSENLAATMMRLADQMGCTPASRARLKVEPPIKRDPFEEFLERGRDKSPVKAAPRSKGVRPPVDPPDDDTPPAA